MHSTCWIASLLAQERAGLHSHSTLTAALSLLHSHSTLTPLSLLHSHRRLTHAAQSALYLNFEVGEGDISVDITSAG